MRRLHTVYVGLGSNLGDARAYLQAGIDALSALSVEEFACSPWYRSAPIGPQDQGDFINAVARLRTDLGPFRLLQMLQAIEDQQGRERLRHWGPRTLDLDMLLYDDLTINATRLRVPHPEIPSRAFVLRPLLDLAPQLNVHGRPVASWLRDCSHQAVSTL